MLVSNARRGSTSQRPGGTSLVAHVPFWIFSHSCAGFSQPGNRHAMPTIAIGPRCSVVDSTATTQFGPKELVSNQRNASVLRPRVAHLNFPDRAAGTSAPNVRHIIVGVFALHNRQPVHRGRSRESERSVSDPCPPGDNSPVRKCKSERTFGAFIVFPAIGRKWQPLAGFRAYFALSCLWLEEIVQPSSPFAATTCAERPTPRPTPDVAVTVRNCTEHTTHRDRYRANCSLDLWIKVAPSRLRPRQSATKRHFSVVLGPLFASRTAEAGLVSWGRCKGQMTKDDFGCAQLPAVELPGRFGRSARQMPHDGASGV
jgi:hypothetical protein